MDNKKDLEEKAPQADTNKHVVALISAKLKRAPDVPVRTKE